MADQPSITCPDCNMRSFNPNDIREGYCGNCNRYTGLASRDEIDKLRRMGRPNG